MRRMQAPDYDRDNIVNLMASLVAGRGGRATGHAPLAALTAEDVAACRCVVLAVVDGLGHDFLAGHHPDSVLAAHLHTRLESVFPTTTASAVTAFLSGLTPQEHGLPGWSVWLRELGTVAEVLPFRARIGGPPLSAAGVKPQEILDWPSLFDRLPCHSQLISPQRIAHSDFNRTAAGGAHRVAYADGEGFFAATERALNDPDTGFVYAYWPDLDGAAHREGVHSAAVEAQFEMLDAGFARLAENLPADVLLLVTADHGLIDRGRAVELEEHPALAATLRLPLCGEPRVAYCYLRPGAEADFEAYVRDVLGDACTARPSGALLDAGWFGRGPVHPRFAERIGDYTLLMHADWIVRDRLLDRPPVQLMGVHGGLSNAERYVPLIAMGAGLGA